MSQHKPKPKSFARRDELIQIEEQVQEKWKQLKIHELDAPEDGQGEKYMATFPYPYMNGTMHLGHAFTLTKAEFATAYQRLKGKRALFPFGFHCTGMPISAAAQKLQREIEQFGNPPNFDLEDASEQSSAPQEQEAQSSADPTKFKTKKSKVAAKTGNIVRQWNILKSMGIPDEEIPKFVDPNFWLRYFPPLAQEDLQRFGLHVDFRRSFITTDLNPYYDSFIRWQFETLKALDKLSFGKRFTVFSPMDNQPCADHDRAEGEGGAPQEYTLIKMKVVAPFPEALKPLEGKNVYLAAATLRPETMYGQTNCWVLPDGEYGAFEISENEVYILTERAALNLAYQNYSKEYGKTDCLLKLTGQDLLGLPLEAPNTSYPVIYTLPMLTVSTTKGTGIVTSVPSDSPDDYAAFMDLKNKAPFRAKYGIKDEWIMPFECVPIIEIAFDDGTKTALAAPKVYQDLKIQSQNDREKLAIAKDTVYLKGFYDGVLVAGPHSGKKIIDVKATIKQELIDAGKAIVYAEPDKRVISRSGDECVVALCDQWYLKYGEEQWKNQVIECLSRMETFNPATRNSFEETIAWLKEWACSRTFGLGSRLPWDPTYLIESLSDSTIYMAYYTVAHLLQGGVLDGSQPGPAGIRPEQMTNQVWDYIFRDGPLPESDIPVETLNKLRREFTYWYPVDLRVSGKDLINNHLTMYLYNHVAIFPEKHWPRAIFTNGHIGVNNEKMSKSKGNFFTLKDIIELYSADCARLACASAGDGLDDANYVEDTANNAILRLTTQLAWIKDVIADREPLRTGPATLFADRVFENEINLAIQASDSSFSRMKFSEALKVAFFDFQNARDTYKIECGKQLMNRDLVLRFIEVQTILLSVICPHFCEHVWEVIGKEGSVINARWPVAGEVDMLLKQSHDYLVSSIHTFRQKLDKDKAGRAKKGAKTAAAPNEAYIYVADNYVDWQLQAVHFVRDAYRANGNEFPANMAALLKKNPALAKDMKKVMPFVSYLKDEAGRIGAVALEDNLPFNEKQLLRDNIQLVASSLGLDNVVVFGSSDTDINDPANRMAMAMPGKPQVYFFASEENQSTSA